MCLALSKLFNRELQLLNLQIGKIMPLQQGWGKTEYDRVTQSLSQSAHTCTHWFPIHEPGSSYEGGSSMWKYSRPEHKEEVVDVGLRSHGHLYLCKKGKKGSMKNERNTARLSQESLDRSAFKSWTHLIIIWVTVLVTGPLWDSITLSFK